MTESRPRKIYTRNWVAFVSRYHFLTVDILLPALSDDDTSQIGRTAATFSSSSAAAAVAVAAIVRQRNSPPPPPPLLVVGTKLRETLAALCAADAAAGAGAADGPSHGRRDAGAG